MPTLTTVQCSTVQYSDNKISSIVLPHPVEVFDRLVSLLKYEVDRINPLTVILTEMRSEKG